MGIDGIDGLDPIEGQRLREEAVRVFRRYAVEFVEALGICPWAVSARRDGRVREQVLLCATPDEERALAAIDALAADPSVEIGILLWPRLRLDRPSFERFASEVRARDAAAREGSRVPFAMAEFHPDAPGVVAPSGAFTSFLRRTPDPTIQLVRKDVLDRVRATDSASGSHGTGFFDPRMLDALLERGALASATKPLHDRIEAHNRATVLEEGLARVVALLDDIRRDRDAAYAEIFARGDTHAARW